MKQVARAALLLAALCAIPRTLPAQTPQATPTDNESAARAGSYDAGSLTKELRQTSAAIREKSSAEELGALRNSLPAAWVVQTPDGEFNISAEPIRQDLAGGLGGPAKARLDQLAGALEGYATDRPAGHANARGELSHILASPEFAAVRPPSKWEVFRQRMAAWLARQVLRLFSGLERYPIGGKILFWVIVVAGVGFVALWVFRFIESRDKMQALPPGKVVVASRTWQEWIRLARQSAGKSDYREAVHSAYWAGITRLADLGALPKDATKTPREYLRFVTEASQQQLMESRKYREPLSKLTASLERIWYGNRGADSNSYRDALQQVEALGCPLE